MGSPRPNRRTFLRVGLTAGTAGIIGIGGYSWLIEPYEVTVERVRVASPRLPEAFHGLKIAQLSDLHYGPYTGEREIGAAVQRCNGLSPDLIVLTGDFVTSKLWGVSTSNLANAEKCARILERLHAPLGVFACLGNHDLGVDAYGITQILGGHRIQVVRNSVQPVERHGARLWMAGLDDCLYGIPDPDRTLAQVPRGEFTILLVHEPDIADQMIAYPVDLQLSGHSHGGQVRLPWLGAPYLPPMARKYPWGLHRISRLQLYSNRGIGTIGLPIRFNDPPEVTLLTLDRSAS